MSRVGQKDTGPEMKVRKAAHAMGYRFRLHRKELPGTPDMIFPQRKLALFIHGCYWHRHPGCRKASIPKSREDYWNAKFASNVARDERVRVDLEARGWEVGVIWECQTKDASELKERLLAILSNDSRGKSKQN
jgi:DNA mismatch endonuclease (patch repair protein)